MKLVLCEFNKKNELIKITLISTINKLEQNELLKNYDFIIKTITYQ